MFRNNPCYKHLIFGQLCSLLCQLDHFVCSIRETDNFWSQSCITKLVFTFLRDIKASFLLWETAISVSLSLTLCCFLILSRLFSCITFIPVVFSKPCPYVELFFWCFLIAAWWETSEMFSSLRPELLLFSTQLVLKTDPFILLFFFFLLLGTHMLQTVPCQLANIVCAWKYHKLMLSPTIVRN